MKRTVIRVKAWLAVYAVHRFVPSYLSDLPTLASVFCGLLAVFVLLRASGLIDNVTYLGDGFKTLPYGDRIALALYVLVTVFFSAAVMGLIVLRLFQAFFHEVTRRRVRTWMTIARQKLRITR